MNIEDKTCFALGLLFEACEQTQDLEIAKKLRYQDPLAHAKEYGTIKMTTSRQAGHSTAIVKLVSNLKGEWLILAPSLDSRKLLGNKLRYHLHLGLSHEEPSIIHNDTIIDIASFRQKDIMIRGSELNGIIVDCASVLKQKEIDEIYSVGLPCMKNKQHVFFIFVQ